VEVNRTDDQPLRRGRAGGVLGVMSLALLLASFRWAHHWNAIADTIVAGWGLATIAAAAVSVWSLRTSSASRRFAKFGVVLGLVSVLALVLVGVLSAAGIDAAEQCGGG
jgi:hypothetical protein